MQLSKLADPFRAVGRSIGMSLWSADHDAETVSEEEVPHTREPSALESQDFSWLTLDEVLSSHPGLLATRLQIITLRQFRESIGDEWDRHCERVGMIADGVVRRRLGPKNYFGRYSDDTFILSFSSLSDVEGRHQAVLVANELMHRLIGERFAGAQICVSEIDTEVLVDGKGGLQSVLVDEAVSEAEPVAEFMQRFDASPKPDLVVIEGDGRARLPVDLYDLGAGADGGTGGAPKPEPEWVPLIWPPEALKRRLSPEHLEVKPGENVPEGVEILFRPTWTARWQMVDAYLAQPRRKGRSGSLTGDAALPRNAATGQLANLDYALLYASLAELTRAVESKRAATFICPVRFSTLVAPYWATLREVLSCFSEAICRRNLLIEVTHIPNAAAADHMIKLARQIRPLCRDILVRTKLDKPRAEIVGAAQPAAIGCRLTRKSGQVPDINSLSAFVEAVGAQKVYFWGAADWDILSAAVANPAVSLANGPSLADDMAESAGSFTMPKSGPKSGPVPDAVPKPGAA